VPFGFTLGRGSGRLDFADGAGHGGPEVFGGGEGLADLGGQAAPFGDGEWGADAAQCELHGDVVATDDQKHAESRILACWVAQVVVDELDGEVELADAKPVPARGGTG
jgi:hypothetical protein